MLDTAPKAAPSQTIISHHLLGPIVSPILLDPAKALTVRTRYSRDEDPDEAIKINQE